MVYPGEIFEHLHSEFFAALEACRVAPDHRAVHQLRTTTRRMEALLNTAKQRRHGNARLERKVDQALKALKPVRSAAGPVRDMDVQLGLLADVVGRAGAAMPVSERSVLSEEGRKLQAELKKCRKDAAVDLRAAIEKSEKKELRRISPLQTDLSGMKWTYLLKDAKALERRSANRLDVADPTSLHEYRKRSKCARYLAEMDGESAQSAQFAKRMKDVLNAIGEWHDWMLLTQMAKEAIGKSSILAKVLKGERERSLRRAVRSVGALHRES